MRHILYPQAQRHVREVSSDLREDAKSARRRPTDELLRELSQTERARTDLARAATGPLK